MKATMRNMEQCKDINGLLMASPTTGEEFSATPGDYWFINDPDHVFNDSAGEPMELLVKQMVYTPVEDKGN